MFGINFRDLKDEDFDQDMFGEYTGAGVIFGAWWCNGSCLKNCN